MSCRREGGFTLLELLVAVVLGAIVSAAVYQTFGTAVDSSRRVAQAAVSTQTWRFFVERLRADVSRLSAAEDSFKGTSNSLQLVLNNDAGTAKASYEVSARREDLSVRRQLDEQAATVVYESDAALQFSFLTDAGWVTATESMPRAVKFSAKGERGERQFAVAVEVEVEADAS